MYICLFHQCKGVSPVELRYVINSRKAQAIPDLASLGAPPTISGESQPQPFGGPSSRYKFTQVRGIINYHLHVVQFLNYLKMLDPCIGECLLQVEIPGGKSFSISVDFLQNFIFSSPNEVRGK